MTTNYRLGNIYHGHMDLGNGEFSPETCYWVQGIADGKYITLKRDTFQEIQQALNGHFGLVVPDEDKLPWTTYENGLRVMRISNLSRPTTAV